MDTSPSLLVVVLDVNPLAPSARNWTTAARTRPTDGTTQTSAYYSDTSAATPTTPTTTATHTLTSTATTTAQSDSLPAITRQLLLFLNGYLALRNDNQLAVLGCDQRGIHYLYNDQRAGGWYKEGVVGGGG